MQNIKQWLYACEPGSSLSHLTGLLLAIPGTVLLLTLSSSRQPALTIVSFAIYGASLILLYSASTIYHLIPQHKSKNKAVWRLIDHIMIYALIAGSYTPIALVALRGGWGWTLFGTIWGLTAIGIILRILPRVPTQVTYASYLFLGWLAVVAIIPLTQALSLQAISWLIAGGVLYTLGTMFEIKSIAKKLPNTIWLGSHEFFHLFVLAGSFSHFWLIFHYLA